MVKTRLEVAGWISLTVLLLAAFLSGVQNFAFHFNTAMVVESRVAAVTGANKGEFSCVYSISEA